MSKITTSTTGGISEVNYKTSTTGGLRNVNYKKLATKNKIKKMKTKYKL